MGCCVLVVCYAPLFVSGQSRLAILPPLVTHELRASIKLDADQISWFAGWLKKNPHLPLKQVRVLIGGHCQIVFDPKCRVTASGRDFGQTLIRLLQFSPE